MNPSEGVREIEKQKEAEIIFRKLKSCGGHWWRRMEVIMDALTQAEKRGFERAKSKIAEICLSPALLPNFNCFDGVCVAKAIRDLTYEEKV